ncbi:hypothetical protein H4217_005395 [Coemansia sp. RSA 1939]|nr:hypothetical protein H4217_005395 [Coemansia sp. RSA 1939]
MRLIFLFTVVISAINVYVSAQQQVETNILSVESFVSLTEATEALSTAADEPTALDSKSQKTDEAEQTDSLTESAEKQQQTDLTAGPNDSSSGSDTSDNTDNEQESTELPGEAPSTDASSTDSDLKTSTTLVKPTSEPKSQLQIQPNIKKARPLLNL